MSGPTDPHPLASPYLGVLSENDAAIGGKARSLARLSALGLPTPPAFAVTTALWTAMRAQDPVALPVRLASLDDLERLERARRALDEATFPAEFAGALASALGGLLRCPPQDRSGSLGRQRIDAPPAETTESLLRYAVRSSSPVEDLPGGLAAGIFESLLPVAPGDVESAIRRVLSSALSPAALAYTLRSASHGPPAPLAVLIHPFVEGDATGAVAWQPGDGIGPRVAVARGALDVEARRTIETAARTAGRRLGAVEIEWVADGPRVVFLQMRAYAGGFAGEAASTSSAALRTGGVTGDVTTSPPTAHGLSPFPARVDRGNPPPPPWRWDSAHNPAPLSVAQAGLVEWVDEVCAIGIRLRVVDGYLFWRPDPSEPAPAAPHGDPEGFTRAVFDALVTTTRQSLRELGAEPPLESVLRLFGSAYQTLFGTISPACRRARAQLTAALEPAFGPANANPGPWLVGVTSAASLRLRLARNLATAPSAQHRRAALAAYLDRFGDESPRWDVAEPTWRECSERLLLLAAAAPEVLPSPPPTLDEPDPVALPPALQARLQALPAGARERCLAAAHAARIAAAVTEDDDALYATLQAAVRRGLLAVGKRLHASGRLGGVDDVFDLPLSVTRALDAAGPAVGGREPELETPDLRALAAAGKAATERARQLPPFDAPPPVAAASTPDPTAHKAKSGVSGRAPWVGLGGAGGRALGHAVHHPARFPLRADAILIAATLLPTELPLVFPAAIVTETGSPLGHVAAQARERGIPAVVGLARALAAIPPGALLLVDGDRGEVTLLAEPD